LIAAFILRAQSLGAQALRFYQASAAGCLTQVRAAFGALLSGPIKLEIPMKRALNLAVAILFAGSIAKAPAIVIHKLNGTEVEVGYVSGTVSNVDQDRHSFTLRWQGKGLTKMEHYYFSYDQAFRVTDGTVYKNGSWADMKKGIRVRITGHSDVADTIEFNTQTGALQNATIYNQRGLAKENKGDFDGAMAEFNQAIRLNPKNAIAYFNRGRVKETEGDLDGAIADFTQAIGFNPRYAAAFKNRGNGGRRKGDLSGANADFNQAVKLGSKTLATLAPSGA
jgi:tetratricopeptide (TPR) repeat protein